MAFNIILKKGELYSFWFATSDLLLAENLFSFLVLPDFFRQLSQIKLEDEKKSYNS